MPDVRMPDGTIIRNVPEGTTRAQLTARLDKHKKMESLAGYGLGDLIANKMTAGLTDKVGALASGGVDYARALLSGKPAEYSKLYQRAQSNIDAKREAYKKSHPVGDWATLPANLMMGMAGKAGALPETLGQMAKVGGVTGLISGFGNARGTAGDQALETIMSTGLGTIIAPILGKALAGSTGQVTKAVKGRSNTTPPARRNAVTIAEKALKDQGMTPQDAAAIMDSARKRGVPLGLMDTGDETRGLVAGLARKPGPNRTLVRDVVIPRQEAQLERVQSAMTRDLGPTANVRLQSEALIDKAKAAAAPLYEQAYKNQGAPIFYNEVTDLLKRPSMRRALVNARNIAAEEGRDPNALGLVFDKDGLLVKVDKPTWQTFDYIKRGIDDVIETYRDPVTGRLNLDTEGRAINNTLRDFLGRIDKVNPDYAAARQAYGGPVSLASAMQKGEGVVNKSADDIAAETANLSPAQLEQYRLGARTALSGALEGRVDNADKVKALVGTPKKREALQQVIGDSGNLDNFLATLADEKRAAETFGRVATGSPTSANDADLANLDGLTGVAANAVGRSLSGQGMIGNGISLARDLARYGLGKRAEGIRSELGALLTETNPSVLADFLRVAAEQERVRQAAANVGGRYGLIGSAYGGQIPSRIVAADKPQQ